jgi:hypothetical protein
VSRRLLAVAVGLAVPALLAACGSSGSSRSDQGRSIASGAGLPKDVADVFALALNAASATFTVSYASTDASGSATQITITQQPPNRRLDVIQADGTVESTFRTVSISYQCTKSPDWSCGTLGRASDGDLGDPLGADVVAGALTKLRDQAEDYDFHTDQRRLVGVDARCLVTTLKAGHDSQASLGASGTLCVSPEGAVLLVDVPTGKLTATDYSTSVATDAFHLPAIPDQTPTSIASSSAN